MNKQRKNSNKKISVARDVMSQKMRPDLAWSPIMRTAIQAGASGKRSTERCSGSVLEAATKYLSQRPLHLPGQKERGDDWYGVAPRRAASRNIACHGSGCRLVGVEPALWSPRAVQYCDAGNGFGEPRRGVSFEGSPPKILIKGGTVANAHGVEVADVYVEDGIIVAVEPHIEQVISSFGLRGIDPHTHLDVDSTGIKAVDDFFSGQAAALAGGTTMHIDFVKPSNGSLIAGVEVYKKKAQKSCMDYGFHMVIHKWDEVVSREMEVMVNEKGINSFKFFMAYKGYQMVNDEVLLQGLKKCKSLGALAMLEGEATARAVRLAGFVNTPLYVVHVMSIDAMEEIAKARQSGQRVIGEPVVSGLVLDDSKLWDPDFITAAKKLVGTDHCAFNSTQKALGIDDFRKIPNGVNGIEERMHLVWDTMVGKVEVTIAGGRIVWMDGQLKVACGSGKFVEMPPFGYLFGGMEKEDARYLSSLRAPVKRQ
ncbi:hypothetical protein EUGRSUZ_J00683 [Eucalyptus grandis]|uniref:Uncharacterized protein n=2 Tax=Eucalyptus grandis TaxID=71139 RepID=A0ACC3J468_EUCGR|nr:hypothetical protein EUGRSUZ_J00683 [Eucalyptus grandis]